MDPEAPVTYAQITPIRADDLVFDDGSNEITVTIAVRDDARDEEIGRIAVRVRRPPVTLVHGYNTKGAWGEPMLNQLGQTRPRSSDASDNFVKVITYGQEVVENIETIDNLSVGRPLRTFF